MSSSRITDQAFIDVLKRKKINPGIFTVSVTDVKATLFATPALDTKTSIVENPPITPKLPNQK